MATRHVPAVWRGLGGLCAAGCFLVHAGCGTMHPANNRGGDPLLGSFNRPIVPTPPPTGADVAGPIDTLGPGVYPAPAVGEGVRPPIPGAQPRSGNPFSGRITQNGAAPSPAGSALAGGSHSIKDLLGRWFAPSNADALPKTASYRSGAAIPLGNRFAEPKKQEVPPSWEQPTDPNAVQMRPPGQPPLTSGSVVLPTGEIGPSGGPGGKAPKQVATVEEGQTVLASFGVKWQRLERVENGEWQFTCGMSNNAGAAGFKQYGARNTDQISAVRAVLEQVQKDR